MLSHAALSNDDFRTAVTAFAGALGKIGPDDRSFTLASGAGADILALVEACRNRGVPPHPGDRHLPAVPGEPSGRRTLRRQRADAEQQRQSGHRTSPINRSPTWVRQPRCEFFNEKLRVPPVRSIERYETYASKTEGARPTLRRHATMPPARPSGALPPSDLQRRRGRVHPEERAKHGVARPIARIAGRSGAVERDWRDLPRPNRFLAAKSSFYSDLAAMVVTPADREAMYAPCSSS